MPSVFADLIQNVALIVMLATAQQYLSRVKLGARLRTGLLMGLLYGFVGVLAMMNPLRFAPGVFYDARSVIMSTVGLFWGPPAAVVAALITGGYRVYLGGQGVVPGLLSIAGSAAIGSIAYYLRRFDDNWSSPLKLWLFGAGVQAFVLVAQLTLPGQLAIEVLRIIGPWTMLLYPLGTLLLGSMLLDQDRWWATQQRLRVDEERLRLALASGNQGSFDVDVESGTVYTTPEYAKLLGFEPDQFNETIDAWVARLHPDDRERTRAYYSDFIEGRTDEFRVEFRESTASGEWVWVLSSGAIVARDAQGRAKRMIGTIQNIDERKRAEEELLRHRENLEELVEERTRELEEANERLREADKAKSDFLASVSHELRTPLNSIIGFSSLLLHGYTGELTDEQREQVATINSSGNHLLALIEDVLDLSKVEAGKTELEIASFDPSLLAEDVGAMMMPLAQERGLELVLNTDSEDEITSDPGKIKQILLNLLGNAVKFTHEGSVELDVRRGKGGDLVFTVRDTGVGIAEQDLPRVFEAFTQIPVPSGAKPPGTGLGLALSKQFAEMIGGEISAHSEVGVGSTFTLCVPDLDGPKGSGVE